MKQRNGIIKNYFWCIVLLLNIYKKIRTNDTRERKRCKGMKDVN